MIYKLKHFTALIKLFLAIKICFPSKFEQIITYYFPKMFNLVFHFKNDTKKIK